MRWVTCLYFCALYWICNTLCVQLYIVCDISTLNFALHNYKTNESWLSCVRIFCINCRLVILYASLQFHLQDQNKDILQGSQNVLYFLFFYISYIFFLYPTKNSYISYIDQKGKIVLASKKLHVPKFLPLMDILDMLDFSWISWTSLDIQGPLEKIGRGLYKTNGLYGSYHYL